MLEHVQMIFDEKEKMNEKIMAAVKRFSTVTGLKVESIEFVHGVDMANQFYYLHPVPDIQFQVYGGETVKE